MNYQSHARLIWKALLKFKRHNWRFDENFDNVATTSGKGWTANLWCRQGIIEKLPIRYDTPAAFIAACRQLQPHGLEVYLGDDRVLSMEIYDNGQDVFMFIDGSWPNLIMSYPSTMSADPMPRLKH
jgi:hypothetical protein